MSPLRLAIVCLDPAPDLTIVRHLTIRGRVQGVGYRYHMQRRARQLGVSGWVRNRRDGSVEALLQGSAPAVQALIAWAGRGPENAAVSAVDVTEGSGNHSGFATLPTA
jgi:acylphosphatase